MKLASKIFKRNDWYITSKFGWRTDPISGKQSYHNGTDYGTNIQKWKQYAIEDGIVLSAGVDSSRGIYAWIRYPRIGKELLHYHLDSVKVKTGEVVKEGTLIGFTGTTGYSTGIHLHLGMRSVGSSVYEDPHAYNYVEPTQTKFKVGDSVILNGTLHTDSLGSKKGKTVSNVKTVITRVAEGKPYPYNTTGDLGWVSESSLTLDNKVIKVGSIVIPTKLVDYRGRKLTRYDKTYEVLQITKNGAVLGAVRGTQRPIWAILPLSNIKEV